MTAQERHPLSEYRVTRAIRTARKTAWGRIITGRADRFGTFTAPTEVLLRYSPEVPLSEKSFILRWINPSYTLRVLRVGDGRVQRRAMQDWPRMVLQTRRSFRFGALSDGTPDALCAESRTYLPQGVTTLTQLRVIYRYEFRTLKLH